MCIFLCSNAVQISMSCFSLRSLVTPRHTCIIMHKSEDESLRKICKYQQNVPQHYDLFDTLVRIEKEYIEGSTNSQIHHFLPEYIAFNQSALRQFYHSALRHEIRRGCHDRCHAVVPFRVDFSGYVFALICLTFTTPSFVLNTVCETSGRLIVTS